MIALLCFVFAILASPFKSKGRLEAENAVLQHQLIVLRRQLRGRVRLGNNDRLFFIQLYRWFPSILQVLMIVRPETVMRWQRVGFRCYWRQQTAIRPTRAASIMSELSDCAACVYRKSHPARWVSAIDRFLLNLRGRMAMLNV